MSENLDCGIRDFSKYDTMETEALEEILRLDSEAPEGQESDTEELLYVMEVLANRRNTDNTGKTALEAWESFLQHYLPEEKDCMKHTSEDKPSVKPFRPWLRRLTAAAAVIVLLVSIPLAANALGWEDIWNAVAKWAKETFSFVSGDQPEVSEPSPDNVKQYESLQEVLAATDQEFDFVPTWIPEGYELDNIIIDENPMQKVYTAFYHCEEKIMMITVRSYLNGESEKVEIDDTLLEIYEASGTEYYIFENAGQLRAVWIKDTYECYVSGALTIEEIKTMIDSIGKG